MGAPRAATDPPAHDALPALVALRTPGIWDTGASDGAGRGALVEIQRARILAAMVRESADRGAAGVTVAHVVARAGVSRRTFYEMFEDREDCFVAAFDDALERVRRASKAADDPSGDWVQRLRGAIGVTLASLDADRRAGLLLIVGSLRAGPHALERRARMVAQLVAFVDRGRAEAKAGTELPELTAEGLVGGALAIVSARLVRDDPQPLATMTSALTSTIVLPYLGAAAARRELARPAPIARPPGSSLDDEPLHSLRMRLTYRTVRVLTAVADTPGGSNRHVAEAAGISDPGQISRLLRRLHRLGLIENTGGGLARGAPNAWLLSERGREVHAALQRQT
jgi:AcrR family transcriptional regulator